MRTFYWLAALLLRLLAFGLLSSAAISQTAESIVKSCAAREYREFDFWIGQWDVFDPVGKKVGVSRIDRISGGCALLENWEGTTGVRGKSLNIYDSTDKQWHQFWVDNGATRLVLDGGLADGRMVLSSAIAGSASGAGVVQRITWSQNADGSVRQLWETSGNGGKAWSTSFDGKYVRRAR